MSTSVNNEMWLKLRSRGRIVAALHLEFFVKGQAERAADLEDFFNEVTSDNRRLEILASTTWRWIVLNSAKLPPGVVETLMVPAGVIASVDILTLLDAEVWARHLPSQAASDKASSVIKGIEPRQGPLVTYPCQTITRPVQGDGRDARGKPCEPA